MVAHIKTLIKQQKEGRNMEDLINEIEQAVKFYANRENYSRMENPSTQTSLVQDDEGMRAEEILELLADLKELAGVQYG